MTAQEKVESLQEKGASLASKTKTTFSYFLVPANFQKGFSLIEILVAIAIVALLGAVSIPNLRKLSKQQEIDSSALQVLNTLKTAQSSAISRIQCPNEGVSDTWTVRLNKDNYSLIANCKVGGSATIYTRDYSPSKEGEDTGYKGSIDVCPGSIDIIFSRSQIGYLCEGMTTPLVGVVNLTLSDSSGELTKVVKIEPGGVIKSE